MVKFVLKLLWLQLGLSQKKIFDRSFQLSWVEFWIRASRHLHHLDLVQWGTVL